MNRDATTLIDITWVAWCAERLREQWPRADATSLEEAAQELWADESLRALGPLKAAERWLRRGLPETLLRPVTLRAGTPASQSPPGDPLPGSDAHILR